jgi:hypothetical protein
MSNDEAPASEAYQVYAAVSKAMREGRVTWLTEDGTRIAAIVPVEVAQAALGLPGPAEECGACKGDRHEDCAQYSENGGSCGCDQRALHGRLMAEKVMLLRASRRPW